MSLTVAELKAKIEERLTKIQEGLAKKERQSDHIHKIGVLRTKLEERKTKLEEQYAQLCERIDRQKSHVEKIVKGSEKLDGHIARWIAQNERDLESIKVLETVEETPSE